MASSLLNEPDATVPRVRPTCAHCGASVPANPSGGPEFCCAGCAYVYRMIHAQGLAGYYQVKDNVTSPVDASVFQPADYSWLGSAQREVEAATSGVPELLLDLQGISCAGCIWLIERLFHAVPGARSIEVNAQYGSMQVRWVKGECSLPEFAAKLRSFGYAVGPAGEKGRDPESRGLVRRIGLGAAFAMNVMLFTLPVYFGMEPSFEWARLFGVLSAIFATLSVLTGGSYFISRAGRAAASGVMQIDLPIAIGICGAYLGSVYGWLTGQEKFIYFDFVATFILLMLVGRWAQVAAVERNRRRLLGLQPTLPPVQIVGLDGQRSDLDVEKIVADQSFLLSSGHALPVESLLESDAAEFSLASMNGEGEPRLFRSRQRVPAGAIYLGRSELALTSLEGWGASVMAALRKPAAAETTRGHFLEKIVRGYLIGIIVISVGAGLMWWSATHDPARTWAVVTAVLVVSCPCAVGLAFPLADEMATVALRRRNVFVRSSELWAKLARVRIIVFDKTGTLTMESLALRDASTLAALDPLARSALFSLVRNNAHPVSQAILASLLAHGLEESIAGEIRETVGFGLELGEWSLGRAGWRDRGGPGPDTVFACSGEVLARLSFTETLRPGVRGEIDALRDAGFGVHILSGDSAEKVQHVAHELGLLGSAALAELTPQEKAEWFDEHAAGNALMLGDGANDSLAFDRALCRGTPVIHRGLLEHKADFYYLGSDIAGIRALFEVNAIRRRSQALILTFSVVYNLLAVGLAVAGQMNPLVAAALMPVNSLLTLALVLGSMRRCFNWAASPRPKRSTTTLPLD